MKTSKKTVSSRKKPTQDRAKFTVEAILKATTQLLEKNSEGVSTNQIAEVAGVSIGSLYQYFPNKDSILGILMERFTDSHFAIVERKLKDIETNNPGLEATTRSIIHSLIESNRKHSRLAKIFVTTLYRPERIKLLQKMDERMIAKLKEYYSPFEGEIRDNNVDMMLFVLIQSIRATSVSVMFHPKYRLDDPLLEDELVHLAMGMLSRKA